LCLSNDIAISLLQLFEFAVRGHVVHEFNLHRLTVAEPWGFDIHGTELVGVASKGIAE
jgi:hypothetical protein